MKGRAHAELCLVFAAATLAGAGCASISARTSESEPHLYPTVYPGPKTIIYGMQHKQGVAHNILVWPFGIIDFPLSAALDTLLLPFDWPYSASQRRAAEKVEPK